MSPVTIMFRTASFAFGLAVGVAVGTALIGCGAESSDEEVDSAEGAASASTHNDSISSPTDTKVTLEPGFWHDDTLTVQQGWRMYHFTAKENGVIAFQMHAEASLVSVEAGRSYQVIATTQNNSTANDLGKPNQSAGKYTIAAMPVVASF